MAKINIKLNNNSYSIPDSVLAVLTADFVAHLGTIAGGDMKVVVGGVEYGIDSSKVSGSIVNFEEFLDVLVNGPNGPNGPKLAPGLYDAENNLLASWSELTSTYGLDVSRDYDGSSMSTNSSLYRIVKNNTNLKDGKKLVIGDITRIGMEALHSCKFLTDVVIPDSVTSIGDSAFSYGENLTSVTIPDSVVSIGRNAFSYCTNPTSLKIGNGLKTIDSCTFQYCTNLTNVTLGNNIEIIEIYAFNNCTSLRSINIPDKVTTIKESAFANCTSLSSVAIGNRVTSIGDKVFQNCNSLTSIRIPNSVETIGANTFMGCNSLASVTIGGEALTEIEMYAFRDCTNVTQINFEGTIEQWDAVYKGYNWNFNVPATHVHCTDGDVAL